MTNIKKLLMLFAVAITAIIISPVPATASEPAFPSPYFADPVTTAVTIENIYEIVQAIELLKLLVSIQGEDEGDVHSIAEVKAEASVEIITLLYLILAFYLLNMVMYWTIKFVNFIYYRMIQIWI